MTRQQLLNLHHYLHDNKISATTYNGQRIDIKTNTIGLRYCEIEGVKFIEQNPARDTVYGKMAQNGQMITWGIRPGSWDLIIDDEIRRCSPEIGD